DLADAGPHRAHARDSQDARHRHRSHRISFHDQEAQRHRAEPAAVKMAERKKIFIADDDRFFRELYQMVLGEEGYDVTFAITGKEAVEKWPGNDPDLIILDVLMPELNGYEVCTKLREMPDFAMTPILMLTGLSADEDKIKGYHVGADDFLTKPFSPKVFR